VSTPEIAVLAGKANAADPDRAAAEWVLGIGGRIATDEGKFTKMAELPEKPFQITAIDLNAAGSKATDVGARNLSGLTGLTWLSLEGTDVSDAGLVHLEGLTNLTTLILNGTPVGDAGLERLKGLTKLTSLGLIETKVTAQSVADLKKALPNCDIRSP